MADQANGDESLRSLVGQLAWDAPSLSPAPLTRVEYTEESGIHLAIKVIPGDADHGKLAMKSLGDIVGREGAQSILATERALFAWLAEHPDHPAQFVSDPVSCLQRLGTELSEEGWRALASFRAKGVRTADARALADVRTVKVDVLRDGEE